MKSEGKGRELYSSERNSSDSFEGLICQHWNKIIARELLNPWQNVTAKCYGGILLERKLLERCEGKRMKAIGKVI